MRGFVSSLVLVALISLLFQSLYFQSTVKNASETSKNAVVLSQRVSEAQYSMQHGFENAVKKAELFDSADLNDFDKAVLLCMAIETLDFSKEAGCITEDYEIDRVLTESIIIKDCSKALMSKKYREIYENGVSFIRPCVKFIRMKEGKAVVGLNTDFDYENFFISCDSGFILKTEVAGHAVKTVIPMGAEL